MEFGLSILILMVEFQKVDMSTICGHLQRIHSKQNLNTAKDVDA